MLEETRQAAGLLVIAFSLFYWLVACAGESWTGQDEAAAEEELQALEEAAEAEELAKLPAVPTQRLPEAAPAATEGEKGAAAEGVLELPEVPTHAATPATEAAGQQEQQRRLEEPLAAA